MGSGTECSAATARRPWAPISWTSSQILGMVPTCELHACCLIPCACLTRPRSYFHSFLHPTLVPTGGLPTVEDFSSKWPSDQKRRLSRGTPCKSQENNSSIASKIRKKVSMIASTVLHQKKQVRRLKSERYDTLDPCLAAHPRQNTLIYYAHHGRLITFIRTPYSGTRRRAPVTSSSITNQLRIRQSVTAEDTAPSQLSRRLHAALSRTAAAPPRRCPPVTAASSSSWREGPTAWRWPRSSARPRCVPAGTTAATPCPPTVICTAI